MKKIIAAFGFLFTTFLVNAQMSRDQQYVHQQQQIQQAHNTQQQMQTMHDQQTHMQQQQMQQWNQRSMANNYRGNTNTTKPAVKPKEHKKKAKKGKDKK